MYLFNLNLGCYAHSVEVDVAGRVEVTDGKGESRAVIEYEAALRYTLAVRVSSDYHRVQKACIIVVSHRRGEEFTRRGCALVAYNGNGNAHAVII